MTSFSRRDLLRRSARTGTAVTLGGAVLSLLDQLPAGALPAGGYGPLVTDPAQVIDLPAGFSYKVYGATPNTAANAQPTTFLHGVDGTLSTVPLPNKADGAAVFGIDGGRLAFVLNHECENDATGRVPKTPDLVDPSRVFNPSTSFSFGGTSTVVLDTNTLGPDGFPVLERTYTSLSGTTKNCAGGKTPWNTWLSCEEVEKIPGGVKHGYVFEVDPTGSQTVAVPYRAMGRRSHEAAAVDPATGSVYLTEDANGPRGLVYKFVPNDTSGAYGSLGNGGALFAMAATRDGVHVPDLAYVSTPGAVLQVTWAVVPDPDFATTPNRSQFSDNQVTRARKYEGIWWGEGDAWIVSSYSDAGAAAPGTDHRGQIWRYDPAAETLTLVYHAAPGSFFDGPDNIVVTPHGGAILCEDGNNPNKYLVGIAGQGPDHGGWALARNAYNGSEFAGADFSPDGRFLFVNAYAPGLVLAITGPWTGGGPDPVIPESPLTVALPVTAAAAAAGGMYWLRTRRVDESAATPT